MTTIPIELVLAIHRRQIQRYGGAPGVRDLAALESAVRQPYQTAFGREMYGTVPDRAAAFAFFVCRNHPFVDGNKRVAASLLLTFLEAEGWELAASEDETYRQLVSLAAGSVTREAWFGWVRANAMPTEASNVKP